MSITAAADAGLIDSLVQRLGHKKLPETKRRVLESILFKLRNSIVSPEDFQDAHVLDIVDVITQCEESDIRVLGVEVLDSIARHPLGAAAVAACLPESKIDDLSHRSAVLLKHSLQQLRRSLTSHVHNCYKNSGSAVSPTPGFGSNVAEPVQASTDAGTPRATIPALHAADHCDETGVHTVPAMPCLPTAQPSALFCTCRLGQDSGESLDSNTTVPGSLCVPAISPSMLFTAPQGPQAESVCRVTPSLAREGSNAYVCPVPKISSIAEWKQSPDSAQHSKREFDPNHATTTSPGACTMAGSHPAVEEPSQLRLKLRSKAAAALLGASEPNFWQSPHPVQVQADKSRANTDVRAHTAAAGTWGMSCHASSFKQGPQTPGPLGGAETSAQRTERHGPESNALEYVLAEQIRCGVPVRFSSEPSLETAYCAHARPVNSMRLKPAQPESRDTAAPQLYSGHAAATPNSIPAQWQSPHIGTCRSPATDSCQRGELKTRLLPSVSLSQDDDQHLFELSVRLQHCSCELDLLAVLQQLAMCTVLDYPAEVLLRRNAVLDSVLDVMSNPDTSILGCLWAIRFIHTLIVQTKQALLEANCTELTPLYNAFEGPDDTGQVDPEEAGLLESYPQPGDAAALPEWHTQAGAATDSISSSHAIFLQALPMLQLSNETTSAVLSMLEELMPLLGLESGTFGMQPQRERISEYLSILAQALDARLHCDGNSAASSGAIPPPSQAVPVLGSLSIHILSLITRLIVCVPIEHAQSVVPAELGMQIGRLWCNPCMDLLIPGWRMRLQPYLACLAPLCERANSLAIVAANSMACADVLLKGALSARKGETPSPDWLQLVPAALLAIAFGSHTDMLPAVVEAIAMTHRSRVAQQQPGEGDEIPASVRALIAALQHPLSSIAMSAWSTVCEHLQGPDRGLQTALLELLAHPATLKVMWRLIMEDKSSCIKSAGAFVLHRIMADGSSSLKQGLLPWMPWLDCCASDAALSQVCAQADAMLLPLADNSVVGEPDAMWSWPQLRILLQRLYSKTQRTRRSAAAQLLALVGGHGVLHDQQVEEDPFRGLLEGGSGISLVQDALGVSEAEQMPVTDVHNMMACACNAGLPAAVRASALQRLAALSGSPRCLAAMAVPSFLMECFQCIEQSLVMASSANENQGTAISASSLGMTQLTVSALALLGHLCCQSKAVLDWALGRTERLLTSVLPLGFHPLTMMRRAVAVFLAPLLFIPVTELINADLFQDVDGVQREAMLTLTPILKKSYYFPFPVREICSISVAGDDFAATQDGEDHGMVAELLGEEGSQKLRLVQLLVALGKLMNHVQGRDERDPENPRDSMNIAQRLHHQVKRCLNLLDASAEELPADAARNLKQTLQLNLTQERAHGLWHALQGCCSDRSMRALLSELCQLPLSRPLSAVVASSRGASTCMLAAFVSPPALSGLYERHIWLHLTRHLLHCGARGMVSDTLQALVSRIVPAAVSMLARWCQGADNGKTGLTNIDEDSHTAGLPTHQEHKQAQPAVTATLDVVAAALQQARLRCSMQERIACAQLLAGVDFVGLLLNSILANSHARRECRYAAAACLHEVVSLCALLRSSMQLLDTAPGTDAQDTVSSDACLTVLEDLASPLCSLLQHIVRQIGMPAQNTHSATFVNRHMLRFGMSMLKAICQSLPSDRWASAWANAIGVFWLTRLLRDREVHVRCQAAHLLAILVHPAAGQMRSVLLRAWPEGGTVMMRYGLSRRQPPSFAAAAMKFTAASMATSSEDVPKAGHDQASTVMSESVSDFGCEALLARGFLWEGVLTQMPSCGQAPNLTAGICALLRVRAACMPDEFPSFLRAHRVSIDMLLQHLDIRHQLAAWSLPEWSSLTCDALTGVAFASTLAPSHTSLCDLSTPSAGESSAGSAPHVMPVLTPDAAPSSIPEDCRGLEQTGLLMAFSPAMYSALAALHSAPITAAALLRLPYAVPAMQAAGGAASLLCAILPRAETTSEGDTLPEGALAATLTAVAMLCPAASTVFGTHECVESQRCAAAAAAAAVQCCRCSAALLRQQPVTPEEMKEALSSAKAHADMDVSVALAYVLRERKLAPKALRLEAEHLISALLADADTCGPVLRSWVDDSEWLCTWEQLSPSANDESGWPRSARVPIGAALLDGLMPEASGTSERLVLANLAMVNGGAACHQKDFPEPQQTTEASNVHWVAVQRVLAHSSEAKVRAITRGLHLSWVHQVVKAMSSSGRVQVCSRPSPPSLSECCNLLSPAPTAWLP
eukprot:jgi/Ulvmu1/4693/UM002_0424.1